MDREDLLELLSQLTGGASSDPNFRMADLLDNARWLDRPDMGMYGSPKRGEDSRVYRQYVPRGFGEEPTVIEDMVPTPVAPTPVEPQGIQMPYAPRLGRGGAPSTPYRPSVFYSGGGARGPMPQLEGSGLRRLTQGSRFNPADRRMRMPRPMGTSRPPISLPYERRGPTPRLGPMYSAPSTPPPGASAGSMLYNMAGRFGRGVLKALPGVGVADLMLRPNVAEASTVAPGTPYYSGPGFEPMTPAQQIEMDNLFSTEPMAPNAPYMGGNLFGEGVLPQDYKEVITRDAKGTRFKLEGRVPEIYKSPDFPQPFTPSIENASPEGMVTVDEPSAMMELIKRLRRLGEDETYNMVP